MKKKIFFPGIFLSILLNVAFSWGQVNLVNNCSFEQYDFCPDSSGQIQKATGWFKTFGSADYYNLCSTNPLTTVPPQINYQLASSGNAFAGINFYSQDIGGFEIIHTQLSAPLVVNATYYVSFKVNLCLNEAALYNIAINKIGAKFTSGVTPLENNTAHVFSNTVITDTVNWVTISGSFVADSAYTHLYLGVFFDTANVTSQIYFPSPFAQRAYYFVDDVSVSDSASVTCPVVGIEELSRENEIVLFPNPATEEFTIYGLRFTIEKMEIYDMTGQLQTSNLRPQTVDVSQFPPGIYFVTLTDEKKNRVTKKFVKL